MSRTWHSIAAAVLTLAALSATAHAQPPDWPSRPIRIIVPAPAGGPYDQTIRPLAQEMSTVLGQPLVIDNRPGAGNIIGAQAGAAAAPDGYVLTMTGMVNTIGAGIYEKVPFDIVTDFAHIGAIGAGAQWLVVNAQAKIGSFEDLVQQAKRAPGSINYASSGAGSAGHLIMELLQRTTGTTMTHVPYKGGAPALQDVLGGIVPVLVIPVNVAIPHVKSGKLRVLAVSSASRSAEAPGAPTFAELGYPQLSVSSWVGLSAPKGTPEAIVRKVHAALETALGKPALQAQLQAAGLDALPTTPEQYTQLVKDDTAKWGSLTRSLGIRAN